MVGSSFGFRRVGTAIVVVALLVLSACSDDKPDATPPPPDVPTVTVEVAWADETIAGQPMAGLDPQVSTSVSAAVATYFARTTAAQLVGAEVPDADRAALFTADAGAVALGPDAAVVFDDGVPTGDRLDAGPVGVFLRGLAAADGTLALVSATFDWEAMGAGPTDPVTVHRVGQLGFVPDGAGGWQVADYDLTVTRSGGGLAAATVTATSTTTALS